MKKRGTNKNQAKRICLQWHVDGKRENDLFYHTEIFIFTVIAAALNKVLLLLPCIILCYGTLCHPNSHFLSHLYKMSVQWLLRNLGQVQESPSAPVGEEWDQTVNEWQTPSKETCKHNLDTYESQSQLPSFQLKTSGLSLSLCNEAFIYSAHHPFSMMNSCMCRQALSRHFINLHLTKRWLDLETCMHKMSLSRLKE